MAELGYQKHILVVNGIVFIDPIELSGVICGPIFNLDVPEIFKLKPSPLGNTDVTLTQIYQAFRAINRQRLVTQICDDG